MTDAQRTFRPEPDAWSPLMVLDHLVRVEGGVLWGLGRQLSAGDRRRDVGTPTDAGMQRLRDALTSGERRRVPETASRVIPTGEATLADLRAEWDGYDARWRETLGAVPDSLRETGLLLHPIAGAMTAEGGAEFVAGHIEHHTRQLDRIEAADGYPA